jgi:hypothetical protein
VARRSQKLDDLIAVLEKSGADPGRLRVLQCTRQFKRSWIELAAALAELREAGEFSRWGFEDFHAYCAGELHLKRATVDKLLVSYHTLERHAPAVLRRDGVSAPIPSYEAIGYFDRASKAANADDAPRAVRGESGARRLEELHHAVFDEGLPVGELRKRFDEVFQPRTPGASPLDVIRQADKLAHRLVELLPDIDGLEERRLQEVEVALGGLRRDLDQLSAAQREPREKARRKAPPRASGARSDA